MSAPSKNLTEEQFGALATIMRLRPGSEAIAACKLVMVDGMTVRQASDATRLDVRLVRRSAVRAHEVISLCRAVLNL